MIKIGNRRKYFMLSSMLAVLMAACGGGGGGGGGDGGGGANIAKFYNGQPAVVVIGQASATVSLPNQGGPTMAYTISHPYGNPYVDAGKLYLPDSGNNRVLVYNNFAILATGDSADFAIGQDSLNNLTSISSTYLYNPQQSMVYNGQLFVADFYNNRVAIYNTVPTSLTVPGNPSVVVGDGGTGCTSTSLWGPETAVAAGGKLFVTDNKHHRVLIWNLPTTSGAPADNVLGQANPTTCLFNRISSVSPDANTMYNPAGIWSDGTRLAVVDSGNNRVLIWNDIANLTDGVGADHVLGQGSFLGGDANRGNGDGLPTKNTMDSPYDGVYFNATQLFVADNGNNRVLVWDNFPAVVDGQAADRVLGEPDFTSVNGYDSIGNQITPIVNGSLMYGPGGVFLSGKQLIVGEYSNSRYLIFNGQ